MIVIVVTLPAVRSSANAENAAPNAVRVNARANCADRSRSMMRRTAGWRPEGCR